MSLIFLFDRYTLLTPLFSLLSFFALLFKSIFQFSVWNSNYIRFFDLSPGLHSLLATGAESPVNPLHLNRSPAQTLHSFLPF